MLEHLKQCFYHVMYKYEKPFGEIGVLANLELWQQQKASLLQLLKNHPCWQEKELAIVFPVSEVRGIDHDIVDEASECTFPLKSSIAPQVHYIVEMDRRGANDAVFYHCDNPDFTDFICSFGFQEAYGSCSDISYLAPYLNTAAVNISSGYYNEHRLHEHINLEQMKYNALRIQEIVLTKSEHFEYRERRFSSYFRTTGDYEEYTLWDYMDNKSDRLFFLFLVFSVNLMISSSNSWSASSTIKTVIFPIGHPPHI